MYIDIIITQDHYTWLTFPSFEHARCGRQLIYNPFFIDVIHNSQVRFLDTDLLPASSPEDYPKIIKSGIDEEGQHPKSPKITGPSGIATLLYRTGRPQLLERLLDVAGTEEYNLRVRTGEKYLSDLYVTRRGPEVEVRKMECIIPLQYLTTRHCTDRVHQQR